MCRYREPNLFRGARRLDCGKIIFPSFFSLIARTKGQCPRIPWSGIFIWSLIMFNIPLADLALIFMGILLVTLFGVAIIVAKH